MSNYFVTTLLLNTLWLHCDNLSETRLNDKLSDNCVFWDLCVCGPRKPPKLPIVCGIGHRLRWCTACAKAHSRQSDWEMCWICYDQINYFWKKILQFVFLWLAYFAFHFHFVFCQVLFSTFLCVSVYFLDTFPLAYIANPL